MTDRAPSKSRKRSRVRLKGLPSVLAHRVAGGTSMAAFSDSPSTPTIPQTSQKTALVSRVQKDRILPRRLAASVCLLSSEGHGVYNLDVSYTCA